ncbi:hypothetical protein [Georgenia subflava]|uniref:hypothetical protein n=1 Tax=Georgenia subflava TaxID=1622177 RepID=UPI00186B4176|nr:hypothetical protein [Georgenia subflava]
MDPNLETFTARYLGVPHDEFQIVVRGRAGRRTRTTSGSTFAPGHCPTNAL